MNRSIGLFGTVVLCAAVAACSSLPRSRDETGGAPVRESGDEPAVREVAPGEPGASEIAQDEQGLPAVLPGQRSENLTCYTGNDDRHARMGVRLVDDQVAYFAFYSKWRPRTCSLEAGRGDSFSRWTEDGDYSTVILADHKGSLRIEHQGGAYRFAFLDVDRGRYCGMPGKINGSLTVTRGKSHCVVQGVMDGHAL